MVRPLSSLAKFSFVISNIRFPPGKRAAWRDTGMPASYYACQSLQIRLGSQLQHRWVYPGGFHLALDVAPLGVVTRSAATAESRSPRLRTDASMASSAKEAAASLKDFSTQPGIRLR